jgi:rSAM/selenodomain-associated transferase 1
VLARLLLFARVPVAGRVKTRLAGVLTEEGAARLYRAFLEDAARACAPSASWESILQAEGDPDDEELARLFPAPWRRVRQAEGDLGSRLTAAFLREFEAGAPAALAIGSDHPGLPRRRLWEAFAVLARGNRAVLVPAEDGGYCAIGLHRSVAPAEVFRDIPWSSPSVLRATLDRLSMAGAPASVLAPSYDVDLPEDLARLRRDLASRDPSEADFPRATARALAMLA